MDLSITGTITEKLDVIEGTNKAGKEWKKQSFLIDTGDQYRPQVCFECFGENKVEMLNSFGVGETVKVHFNLSSREYNNNYYHNVDAWRIESTVSTEGTTSTTPDDDPF